MINDVTAAVLDRIRNMQVTLAGYRARHPSNDRIEEVMTQLERVQSALENEKTLGYSQKDGLNFNLVEGTPLERNEDLVAELYSIKNFAMNAL